MSGANNKEWDEEEEWNETDFAKGSLLFNKNKTSTSTTTNKKENSAPKALARQAATRKKGKSLV